MKVGVGHSDLPDSVAAGRQAATMAFLSSGRKDSADLALLFCTATVNQALLREAVSSAIGTGVPIYGGGASGVITNDYYGYGGDQVGVALIWLDGVGFDVVANNSLLECEEKSGIELGKGLAELGVRQSSPVLLFYDSVRRSGNIGLVMATWLLEGIEKGMGFLPALAGAGFIGDHACSPASQFIGSDIGEHNAMAMVFGEGVRIDTTIMHGCRPGSQYYTVTKSEGPVILEINGRPALTFISEALGHSVKPSDFPFFLIFGINSGPRWAEYDEDNYASRLCLGIDPQRDAIIMFEPDMVPGTEFQLMFRSMDLDYMRPTINSMFENLGNREPVFALYFDCAGRASGYGGTDVEDALILQETVAGRVPILGLYSGVEIAPVAGRPRGLDWSGVFCLFSTGKSARKKDSAGVMKQASPKPPKELTQEGALQYYCRQNLAKVLELDNFSMALRHELELKRRGFQLLSYLSVSLRQTDNYEDVFIKAAQRINASLNMQKTIVLLADGTGLFSPLVMHGFSVEEKAKLTAAGHVNLPPELLECDTTIVNSKNPGAYVSFRQMFNLPNFIASPIVLHGETLAILITGRMSERPPFLSPLGKNDAETVHAITELLGSVLVRLRLQYITQKAETDGLTGLYNRTALQGIVEEYLANSRDKTGAFMMIDVDFFKVINDSLGHLVGDRVLTAAADAMKAVLRETDVLGRHGGDEFVIFCRGLSDRDQAMRKASQLQKAWEEITPEGSNKHITGSIGVALAPSHGTTFTELYNNADAALYKAKAAGRDCCVIYSDIVDGP
ncbi:MAG: GGDEF domain-containing protein [Holophagaceae bacterium]|nr:GGDEF domain-containing protein [Holophagaceae bacterium]